MSVTLRPNAETLDPRWVEPYLNRIGLHGPLTPDIETLFRLQNAHLMQVPYENLDIIRGVSFTLEPEAVLDKIVTRRRGGYCFELNGAFAWLLRAIGYPVEEYFARFLKDSDTIPMRRHRVLRVAAEGRDFICDVGVGGPCPNIPLELREGLVQTDREGCYRFARDPFLGWIVETEKRGDWLPFYAFTEEPQLNLDFETTDFYCQHAPDSFFRQNLMVSRKTADGRVTLREGVINFFAPDGVTSRKPETQEELYAALRTYFGIQIPV